VTFYVFLNGFTRFLELWLHLYTVTGVAMGALGARSPPKKSYSVIQNSAKM